MGSECPFAISKVESSEPYPGFLFPPSLSLSHNLALTKLKAVLEAQLFIFVDKTDLGETFTFYFNTYESNKHHVVEGLSLPLQLAAQSQPGSYKAQISTN